MEEVAGQIQKGKLFAGRGTEECRVSQFFLSKLRDSSRSKRRNIHGRKEDELNFEPDPERLVEILKIPVRNVGTNEMARFPSVITSAYTQTDGVTAVVEQGQ